AKFFGQRHAFRFMLAAGLGLPTGSMQTNLVRSTMSSWRAGAVFFLLLWAMTSAVASAADGTKAYDYSFEAIEGGKMPLEQWRGKVPLIVNTASFCGFTPQYQGLQALWQRYQTRGLIVIGVPSNDFGGQEPNSDSEILGFCQGAYNVTFPLT